MSEMRPFFTFFGGKWRLAPKYPSPTYPTIIEPFAGSAGYSVRYNAPRVILLDADPAIIGVWHYLIGASEREVLALPDVAHDRTVSDYGLCPEARDFVGFWMNKAMTAPCNRPSKWLRSGVRPESSWGPQVRARIAGQLQQIRHWQAYNLPWWEAPDLTATWFVDPPYMKRGTRYRFGSDLIDFAKLGEWCQEPGRGQVIVCENEGADWLPFQPFADAKTARANRSAEVVWLNEAQPQGDLFAPAPGGQS
jgi:hypothetical protein